AFAEVITRGRPDCIVLETTGIAEPQPLLDALADPPKNAPDVRACRVITVVDAEAGLDVLERHSEARAQVETADRILLSKLDRADPARLPALHATLARLNPRAERAGFPDTGAGTAALVPWLIGELVPRPIHDDNHAHDHVHRHPHQHGQLGVVALTESVPLSAEPLLAMCEALGANLVRAKGFVHIHGETRRMLLERAGHQLHLRPADAWAENETRRSEIVLIGEGLDAAALERQLWACRVERASDWH
ncbi:MAG TPA: GTP-binding protein, partial [Polyangia bacterium]